MGAPAGHPAFPRDAWPTFELKRMPNGEMGVLMEFPATPELAAQFGIDILGFLMEPRRVETMHLNAADMLDALGLIKAPGLKADIDACYQFLVDGLHPGMKLNEEAYEQAVQLIRSQPLSVHLKMAAHTIKEQQARIDELRTNMQPDREPMP